MLGPSEEALPAWAPSFTPERDGSPAAGGRCDGPMGLR